MARKTPSRVELRRQVEAAEAQEKADGKTPVKKKAVRKKATTRKKASAKPAERKRLMWGVFNGSMKEEGRFPYDQRDEAEAKMKLLRSKSKKLYFIQPIKELIVDPPPAAEPKQKAKEA